MTDDPIRLPLERIAAAVGDGSLDPDALAAQAIATAERTRGLNAFVALASEPAVGRSGVLAGVPYAAKDAIATAGLPTCAASPALAGWTANADAEAIRLLENAGATLIGKTNMHELSFGVTSNNAAFGAVANPHAPDRIAGGSSGGSAVAVAVGAAAFALAADTGGSARIPAALCGLVGFRPTTGRWPDGGLIKVSPTRDTIGVIARTAEDALLVDTVLTGAATDVAASDVEAPGVAALRLGLPRDPYFSDLDDEAAAVIDRFLDRLRQAGTSLVDLDGSGLHDNELGCGFPIALYEARIEMSRMAGELGLDLTSLAERIASPDVRGIVASLIEPGDEKVYRTALETGRPALQQTYTTLFSGGIDALLIPTTPLPAALIGEDDMVTLNGRREPTFPTYARNTSPASVAGVPSVSIPVGRTRDGLPVGMLVEGPAGSDRAILSIAGALMAFAEPVPAPTGRDAA